MKMAKIQTTKDSKEIISMTVPVIFVKNKETGNVFADCPALGLTTCGKTFLMAQKFFREAFSLWYEIILNRGNLRQVLIELGWRITGKKIALPKKHDFKYLDVPVELLSSYNQDFNISRDLL